MINDIKKINTRLLGKKFGYSAPRIIALEKLARQDLDLNDGKHNIYNAMRLYYFLKESHIFLDEKMETNELLYQNNTEIIKEALVNIRTFLAINNEPNIAKDIKDKLNERAMKATKEVIAICSQIDKLELE